MTIETFKRKVGKLIKEHKLTMQAHFREYGGFAPDCRDCHRMQGHLEGLQAARAALSNEKPGPQDLSHLRELSKVSQSILTKRGKFKKNLGRVVRGVK